MAYALGAVKPFVADVANTVGPRLGVTNIGGWRATAGDMAGHPAGRALDLQVGADRGKGDRVAAYFTANAGPLLVDYVMWQQRMWKPGVGWKGVKYVEGEKPGYDPNHYRHVHVSFTSAVDDGRRLSAPAVESGVDGLPWWSVLNPAAAASWVANQLGDTVGAVTDGALSGLDAVGTLMSRSTWLRVSQVVGGAGLILLGVVVLIVSSDATGKVGQLATLIPNPATKAAGAVVATASATDN